MFVDVTPTFDPNEAYLKDAAAHCGRALYAACATARNARHTAVRHPSCAVSARLRDEADKAVKVAQREWSMAQDILQDYTRHRGLKTYRVF